MLRSQGERQRSTSALAATRAPVQGSLDVYTDLFGDDLAAVANRLDEAVAARDKDYLRTASLSGGVVDLEKRRSPGR